MDQQTTRIWKEKPPGEEQLLLEGMFRNGSITAYATAESVRLSSAVFNGIPTKTFAVHFRKTKANMGEYRTAQMFHFSIAYDSIFIPLVSVTHARNIPNGVIPPSPPSAKNAICNIPELAGKSNSSTSNKRPATFEVPVEIVNPPYHTWQYTDHDAKTGYVCVAINIFTGSSSISFDITEDGLRIVVRFAWPTAMYSAAEMFAAELEDGTIPKHHPMIHAMSSTMLDLGVTENSKPEGQWIINLPCEVRREVTSYKMSKIQSGTTKIMFLRFEAYQNDAIIDQANRTLTFD